MAPSSNWLRRPASQAGNVEFESHRGHQRLLVCSARTKEQITRRDGLLLNYHRHSTSASFKICGSVICGLLLTSINKSESK